jgi:transposase InsO family protein
VVRFLVWAISAAFRPRVVLIAENLCLRQQLLVLQRRHPQPRLRNADRRFWIIASRWFGGWHGSLLIVKPETVLRWHRRGWRAYWSWRSRRQRGRGGRRPIPTELQALIRRITTENRLWGQKRIQAELARLGFAVSARTVAKYMNRRSRGPSSGWRKFLKRHESSIWACDFFCVQTILFQTLYVFFVVRHINREILHVAVTPFPTAEWVAQQVVECCAWDRLPPRFLIHDRDSRYGVTFDRRVRHLGIKQLRTPFRAPRANAISERWVKSVRTECLDHILVFNEAHLRRAISAYVVYFNYWRPHRSLGQRAPCESTVRQFRPRGPDREIMAEPVLGGLHHIYRRAA